jgi:hypothetical protein
VAGIVFLLSTETGPIGRAMIDRTNDDHEVA